MSEIKNILSKYKSIAMVGVSKDPKKTSTIVMKYMQDYGFKVYPVNPSAKGDKILGEPNVPEELICAEELLNSLPLDVNSPEALKVPSLVIISELSDVIFPLEFILAALDLISEVLLDNAPEASIEESLVIAKVPFAVVVAASSIKLLPAAATESLEVSDPEADRVAKPP